MAMLANGTVVGDGSWVLNIFVTDLKLARKFRVKGDAHVGGVMLKVVQDLDVTRDWSDHALWWPERNRWLSHTRSTLDQYGVSADAQLHFTPMHKNVRVQLPDLQCVVKRVDFSVPVFNSVIQLCKELGIRYPEEMSLKRYIPPEILAKGLCGMTSLDGEKNSASSSSVLVNKTIAQSQSVQHLDSTTINIATGKMPIFNSTVNLAGGGARTGSLPPTPNHKKGHKTTIDRQNGVAVPHKRGSLPRSPAMHRLKSSRSVENGVDHSEEGRPGFAEPHFEANLVNSPKTGGSSIDSVAMVTIRPKNFTQKAALNSAWLDSSRSLAEQRVDQNDLILMRFKFSSFFDLNPKYDPVRINQIYEQAKWALFMEEFDFTEEEAFMFAALQLQVQLRSQIKRNGQSDRQVDDVDVLLNELETTLESATLKNNLADITTVPELADYLKYFKPKKFTLKGWRKAYFTFKDLSIRWYSNESDTSGTPSGEICLKSAEVSHDVNLSENKFGIKLLIPSAEGMSEFWIRCDTEQQYVKWLSGCKLASKGKSMADVAYPNEVETVRRFLAMQHPAPVASTLNRSTALSVGAHDFEPEHFLPARYLKKLRSRQYIVQRVLEAHTNVNELKLTDAKLELIKAWQALPEYGQHYFVVRFRGARKPELLSIMYNRMVRMSLESGEALKTWRFGSMKKWHVNWEIKHIFIQMEDEEIEFSCLSADCKVVHEFIGGYIFLSMRSKDHNQVLNEELFHKLTGGWQ